MAPTVGSQAWASFLPSVSPCLDVRQARRSVIYVTQPRLSEPCSNGGMKDLQALLAAPVDATFKGYPPTAPPCALGALGSQGWNLFAGDLGSPVAILRQDVMASNQAWMRRFLELTGTGLCPHGKTTMAPQLFHRQLADGAWGITLATPSQARVAFQWGIPRVLLANQLIAPNAIRALAGCLDEDPSRELYAFVDSADGVDRLANLWKASKPLPLLLELGWPGGRCGVRTLDEALALARRVSRTPNLRLVGLACYEGIVVSPDAQADVQTVDAWLERLVTLARIVAEAGCFQSNEILLSAGGSAYFDRVAHHLGSALPGHPTRILLRSGCYLVHDAGHYQRLVERLEGRLDPKRRPEGHLAPALEVWTQVLSRPEPGLVFLDAGKRDLPYDLGLPQPGRWARADRGPEPCPSDWRITALHDQHARLEVPPEAPLRIGDRIGLAVSHPCTTFDRWPLLFEVAEDGSVLGGIRTLF